MATKKTKQNHLTPSEVADTLKAEKEQKIDQECAAEIEEALKKYGRALQPFLARSEFGDQPRVRLVRMPAPESTDTDAEIAA